MKETIELCCKAHNGGPSLWQKRLDHLPGVGTAIAVASLENSSCTGLFVVVRVQGTVKDNALRYEVTALETDPECYQEGAEALELMLTVCCKSAR